MKKLILFGLLVSVVLISGCVQEDQAGDGIPATFEPVELTLKLEQGDTAVIPQLIDYLDSEEVLMTEPPSLARDYAHYTLVDYSGQDFGYDKQAWTNWWNQQ